MTRQPCAVRLSTIIITSVILVLANHVGDRTLLRSALAEAR
ncbi:DUF2783 domain-containing protein [Roseivivax sp. CAU 1753]